MQLSLAALLTSQIIIAMQSRLGQNSLFICKQFRSLDFSLRATLPTYRVTCASHDPGRRALTGFSKRPLCSSYEEENVVRYHA